MENKKIIEFISLIDIAGQRNWLHITDMSKFASATL